ncbi:hypothetical protein ABZ192_06355 [Streptomyces sp. NPDC006235]|uniref:hypothetical protein n=1 Tax=Streptomyces sp. NPDC006235 TaxID=3156736 RepID=UPI0033A9B505
MIRRPDAQPGRLTGPRRHPADAGHHDLALRRDIQDSAGPARPCRWSAVEAAFVGSVLRGGGEVLAELARRCRWSAVEAGLVGPALRRDVQDSAEPARTRRRPASDTGPVGPVLPRGVQVSAEPACPHRQPTTDAGRVYLPLIPSRHESPLVELAPVADEIPPWWGERRPSGRKAA